VHNHFAITPGLELVTLCFEFLTQFREVIDLTVMNNLDTAFPITDGTATRFSQIKNTQPTMNQSDSHSQKNSMVIGPSLPHRQRHSL
jgi:hypothetical protein